MPWERVTGLVVVASIVMMAGTVLTPSGLLGAPLGHAGKAPSALSAGALLPRVGARGAGAFTPSVSFSGPAATDDRGPFTVTFSIVNPPKPGLEITFRACYHGTCCDVYVIDGEFAGVGNCFTFVPLPADRPATGSSPAAGSTGNLTVTATTTSATFTVPNGTLWYAVSGPAGYRVIPGGSTGVAPVGNLTVNGANLTEAFGLAKGKTYSIKYRETGLIPGTTWCTLFSNCTSGRTASVTNLTPGPYLYSVAPVAGYSATLTVNGKPQPVTGTDTIVQRTSDVTVKFTPDLYATTLNETGLAIGKRMHLSMTCTSGKTNVSGCYGMKAKGSCTGTTTGCNVTLMLRNGTYTWKITPIKGYTLELDGVADPTWSGTFSVAGGFNNTHNYIGKVTLIK